MRRVVLKLLALTTFSMGFRPVGCHYDPEVDRILAALRTGAPWNSTTMAKPPATTVGGLWNEARDGPWDTAVISLPKCPRRVFELQNPGSIRTKARIIWRDSGNCTATGNLDAGMCVNSHGVVRCLPSAIIFGTGKGGTAELQSWLQHHPALRRFGDIHKRGGGGEADYFGRELKDIKHLERTWRQYLNGFEAMDITALRYEYTFEKSPGYLAHTTDPGLMSAVLPSIKLIAILRNPTDRAFSHFQMQCNHIGNKMDKYRVTPVTNDLGHQVQKDVSAIFRHKKVGFKRPYCSAADFDNFVRKAGPGTETPAGIFLTGLYALDLKRWYKSISPDQILIVFTEDLHNNAEKVIDQIQKFLGLVHHNYSSQIETLPGGLTGIRGATTKASHAKYPEMSTWARKILDGYYQKPNADLAELLGKNRSIPVKWPLPNSVNF